MKKYLYKSSVFLLVLGLFVLCSCGSSETPLPEKQAGSAYRATEHTVRLAVFHPTEGNVKILEALRENGLLAIEDLLVIGVYHQKQKTDFDRAEAYVMDKGIDWFTFRKVRGELGSDRLFQKNSCSQDFEEIFKEADGVLFLGGDDIPPRVYGRKAHPLTATRTPFRHYLEVSMIFHLLGGLQDDDFVPFLESAPDFPILGICLGSQSLNIGTGGTMIQDIPTEVYGVEFQEDITAIPSQDRHRNPFRRLYPEFDLTGWNLHPIRLVEKGKLCLELGFSSEDTPHVLSSHHQMLENLGKGIRVLARSMDGKVIEAVDHEAYPHVLGVQFHPEMAFLWDDEATFRFRPGEDESSLALRLREKPPSQDFHRKLWGWFGDKLVEFSSGRRD